MDPKTYAQLVTIETGLRLRAARERHGLSLREVAVRSGHSLDVISAVETGVPGAGVHLRDLTTVFTVLGLDLAETVEKADDAVRREYGDPRGLPRPRHGLVSRPAPAATDQ